VNPDRAKSQFEGAAVFGTSISRYGEITAKNGAIEQSNFDDYQVTRLPEAPRQTNVYIVENDAPPAGIGEPGVSALRSGALECDLRSYGQARPGVAAVEDGFQQVWQELKRSHATT
jgi:isoquinoline 1-oxidoreductase beta subunit